MEGRFGSGVLWNAGLARKMLVPTRTHNPTPAASALLGKKRVTRGKRVLARRQGRRSAHRGNPVPAVLAIAAEAKKLPVIGGLLNRHPEDKARMAQNATWFAAALGGDAEALNHLGVKGGVLPAGTGGDPGPWASPDPINDAAAKYHTALGAHHAAAVTAPAAPEKSTLASILATPGAAATAAAVTRAVLRRPRRRQGTRLYIDTGGREHYTRRSPGAVRIPRGATLAPEAAAAGFTRLGNPFFGKVGGGGAGQTAGQIAVAGAAGVGAYLVTQRLLQYLGGRSQTAEEAGVSAAKALHDALEDYKTQHGAYPPPDERQRMKAAYQAELVKLGYDPVTFTRTRSAISDFLETYNPLGG